MRRIVRDAARRLCRVIQTDWAATHAALAEYSDSSQADEEHYRLFKPAPAKLGKVATLDRVFLPVVRQVMPTAILTEDLPTGTGYFITGDEVAGVYNALLGRDYGDVKAGTLAVPPATAAEPELEGTMAATKNISELRSLSAYAEYQWWIKELELVPCEATVPWLHHILNVMTGRPEIVCY